MTNAQNTFRTITTDATAGATQTVLAETFGAHVGVTQGRRTEVTLTREDARSATAALRDHGYKVWA
jgi:hypothetical protein